MLTTAKLYSFLFSGSLLLYVKLNKIVQKEVFKLANGFRKPDADF